MAREKAPMPAAAPASDKKRAIDTAMAQIEKMYGKGSIMRFGDNVELNVDYVPTGSLALDVALGIGGLPRGRIIEIYGPESSGKTTLALHVVAEAQKKGGEVAFVDAEHALDPTYARALGVNVEEMLIAQPDTGEQALEITEALVRSGAIGKTNTIVIFINQLREKVVVMYGNPEVTTGGKALKFYASVRIDVRKTEALKNGADVIGAHTKCKVVKNKVAPPFKVAEFDILYGSGISKSSEIIDMAIQLDIISRSGAWFYYGEDRIGQGKDNVRKYIESDKAFMDELEGKIREKVAAMGPDEMTDEEFDLDDLDTDIDI